MNPAIRMIFVIAISLTGARQAMAIEEASYQVVVKDNQFEVREYAAHVLAETLVDGTLEKAGSKAFDQLFRYISGDNQSRNKVAMTAPVSQERAREKIKMTAPVSQQQVQEKWAVSFMMPAKYTLETLPVPSNPAVTLRQVPARRMATVRYSGLWSEARYLEQKTALESWMRAKGLTASGAPVWARYNPPFTPWFMRRNEILIPLMRQM